MFQTSLYQRFAIVLLSAFLVHHSATACPQDEGLNETYPMLKLNEFHPKSMLKVKQTQLNHAQFPVIDVHTHFGFRQKGDIEALNRFVETMDRHRIAVCVSLDARLGEEQTHLNFLKSRYPNRFAVFAHIDFVGNGKQKQPTTWVSNQPGFVRTVCEMLHRAKENGIVGVKFFKQFGLGYKKADGSLVKIDDPRFDPIWKTCGELKLPIIIHTGDPAAFFEPIDANNERFEELSRHPDWSFYGDRFPSRNELLSARNRVIQKHPDTLFIGAHMAGNPEDLETVSAWIEAMPNLYVELASRIGELGATTFYRSRFPHSSPRPGAVWNRWPLA